MADTLWIFGCGRSGSTWLARLLGELCAGRVWMEPGFGHVFGPPAVEHAFHSSPFYVLAGPDEHWIPPVRAYVTAAVEARFPGVGAGDTTVLKDQNASAGAPRLSRALPDSKFVALIRDPRDVLASILEPIRQPDSWTGTDGIPMTDLTRDQLVEGVAKSFEATLSAFDLHQGPKSLITYESLLADSHSELTRLLHDLRMDVAPAAVAAAVEKHSWARIPDADKGAGKFFRRATPGTWGEVLTPDEIAAIENASRGILARVY